MYPDKVFNRKPVDRRLGIKSSLPNPESAFAALYIIWKALGCPSTFHDHDMETGVVGELNIDSATLTKIVSYWNIPADQHTKIKSALENSAIFSAQIEPIQVLFELYFKMAKVTFKNNPSNNTIERKGEFRYQKKFDLTTNMDIIDLIICDGQDYNPKEHFKNVLFSWLEMGVPDNFYSNKLKKIILIFSEDTIFKDKENNIQFTQSGIYSVLSKNKSDVTTPNDPAGPLRILRSVIKNGLHPILKEINKSIKYTSKNIMTPSERENYIDRVNNYFITTGFSPINEAVDTKSNSDLAEEIFPRNMILYGAPGTGKSHELNQRINALSPSDFTRVTFYSDYSYAQFVGGYKPVPVYISDDNKTIYNRKNDTLDRPGVPSVEYNYVMGPLLEIFVEAKKKPDEKFLLIIEELNRADAASVFGDFFQLLDRNNSGESVYGIRLSDEAHQLLLENGIDEKQIRLPSNLFIWATLNNADQGVFPIDTAFKRRWSFEYLPLNKHQNIVEELVIPIKNVAIAPTEISWNTIRHKINRKLETLGIQEDLMIGPFFLREEEMLNDEAFKYKLVAYLRDDILRHQHREFFLIDGPLHRLIDEYEAGNQIFNFELSDN